MTPHAVLLHVSVTCRRCVAVATSIYLNLANAVLMTLPLRHYT